MKGVQTGSRFIGAQIMAWLKYYRMKQIEVAVKLGVTPATVCVQVRGENQARPSLIARYAAVFGLTVDEFLAGPPEYRMENIPEVDDRLLAVKERVCRECYANTSYPPCRLCRLNQFFQVLEVAADGVPVDVAVKRADAEAEAALDDITRDYDERMGEPDIERLVDTQYLADHEVSYMRDTRRQI